MSTVGETARENFRTDVQPSLFIDNWGVDTVVEHGSKISKQIDAAVALAQLLSSIHSGDPLNTQDLNVDAINGLVVFDGSDGNEDHFFSLKLRSIFRGGSYQGDRVSASFDTGSLNLSPASYVTNPDAPTFSGYDMRWSTLRGDVVAKRPASRFEQDLHRIVNATEALQGLTHESMPTERPSTCPGTPSPAAYLAGLNKMFFDRAIFIGETPLIDVAPEPTRAIHIPFLDN
ncbi:MAG TPA: hypothetical protein VIH90_08500 [Candidatus Saccharimonadales bacterium]